MNTILLATAAVVGLPVLLHLIMKQEPKRLPFPAVRFLQQKRRINQRKMKLRHFLLLALRMLLLGLFGLALFQPILPSTGLDFGITLTSEQPVAAVIVLDTSPSMGYTAGGQSRLEEARRRALELLDDIPSNSRVAVIDPAEPGGGWEQSIADARRRLEALREPHAAAIPVTQGLAAAYQLLRTLDQEAESAEPLPRLVVVFSDRAAGCWDASRVEDLSKLRDAVPSPPVAHLFADVGIDQPVDVAVLQAACEPPVIPQGQPALLTATLGTSGPGVETTLRCRVQPLHAAAPAVPDQTKLAVIPAGGTATVTFPIPEALLQPGVYQVEFRLETPDNLLFNNVRYLTFKVAQPRRILTLADSPDDASFWQIAHSAKGEFLCEVKRPAEMPQYLGDYEAVVLLNVSNPAGLWPPLLEYTEAGGKLLIIPGGDATTHQPSYQPAAGEAAARLLPGALAGVFDTNSLDDQARKNGVPWRLEPDDLRHPLLAPFQDWKLRGNVDVVLQPRQAWRYWLLELQPESMVAARYADADDPASCRPAVVERLVGPRGGRVLMLTTRLDTPGTDRSQLWNNYWDFDNHWVIVLPNLLMRYLCGDSSTAPMNFTTGQAVPLSVPRTKVNKLRFEGPGVTARDAEVNLDAKQVELRLPPTRTTTAGSFRLFTPDRTWLTGFSLNPPPTESELAKVPAAALEELLGAGSVVPIDRRLAFRDVLKLQYNQPWDLTPWLLMMVLLLLAAEAFVANRFYRSR